MGKYEQKVHLFIQRNSLRTLQETCEILLFTTEHRGVIKLSDLNRAFRTRGNCTIPAVLFWAHSSAQTVLLLVSFSLFDQTPS